MEISETKNVILSPNWNLLDSTFESYKLSLQQLPIQSINPCCRPDTVPSEEGEFSYNKIKVLSMHNYLFGDPWNSYTCYFVDDTGKVRRISAVAQASEAPQEIFQLGSNFLHGEHRLPVTISFPSSTLCLVSDGTGLVYLIATGNREEGNRDVTWTVVFAQKLNEEVQNPIMLLHSRYYKDFGTDEYKDSTAIGILILRFQNLNQDALVDWITLVKRGDQNGYEICDRETFKGKQAPFYAVLGKNISEICMGSHSKLDLESDCDSQNHAAVDAKQELSYTWSQTEEAIELQITIPDNVDENCVICSLSETALNVAIKNLDGNDVAVVDGQLFGQIDEKLSKWSVAGKTLEMTMQKKESQLWPCVVLGDATGLFEQKGSEVDTEMDDSVMRGMQPTGIDIYEDCDDLPAVDSKLYCFSSASKKFTHEASIASNQWLFNCYYDESFCTVLRHDVDALVWRSESPKERHENPWTHAATFNALGYVRASKEDVKYGGCSPNASYSALCESSRRVFVYHSPTVSASPVRNRTTKQQMHISRQQVVSLPSSDLIIGFVATTEVMFILTKQSIFVVKVTSPDA